MGFKFIGQYESSLCESIGVLVQNAITKAVSEVSRGTAVAAMNRWFGDSSPAFKKKLAKDLNNLRANLNCRSITVGFMTKPNRDRDTNAATFRNDDWGLKIGNPVSHGNSSYYGMSKIFLNEAFRNLPMFLPLNGGSIDTTGYKQSRFNTLAHELSHYILGTCDEKWNDKDAYGTKRASRLAANKPNLAYTNAENWGIFIEAIHRNIS